MPTYLKHSCLHCWIAMSPIRFAPCQTSPIKFLHQHQLWHLVVASKEVVNQLTQWLDHWTAGFTVTYHRDWTTVPPLWELNSRTKRACTRGWITKQRGLFNHQTQPRHRQKKKHFKSHNLINICLKTTWFWLHTCCRANCMLFKCCWRRLLEFWIGDFFQSSMKFNEAFVLTLPRTSLQGHRASPAELSIDICVRKPR